MFFFCFFQNFKLRKVYVRYVWKTAKAGPPSIIWAESFSLLTKYLFEPWRQKGSFVPLAGKNSLISPPGLLPNSPHWGIPSIWTTDLVDRISGERSNVCASVIWVIISYELHKTEQELFSLITHFLWKFLNHWRKYFTEHCVPQHSDSVTPSIYVPYVTMCFEFVFLSKSLFSTVVHLHPVIFPITRDDVLA